MTDFKNKKIAVVGLGVEGMSTVGFLQKKGALIWVLDKRKKEELDQNFVSTIEQLGGQLVLGEDYLSDLSQYDVIVRSPGVPLKIIGGSKGPNGSDGPNDKKPIITSQTKIFFDLCPAPIVGVTGTKGKGTTASLIYEMLKASGRDAYLGGNIGTPPLTFLNELKKDSIVVLELSSFQLQDLHKSPHIAVMLMVVPEHLDKHADMQEYVEAKRNILRYQDASDFAVINRDYIASNESDIYTDGQVFYITRERATTEQGAFIKDDAIWIKMKGSASNAAAAEWKIIDTDKIALKGKHNWENAAAAAMAATLAGATKSDIYEVLKTFTGLEHRLELVKEVNGVQYYDDSFSTTPETAIAAIQSFENPEVLILGGSSKNSDFLELAEVISKAENIRAIIGVGDEWERIKDALKTKNVEKRTLLIEGAKDMKTVVQAASKIAQPGDVVLLSPACASFGMFKDYKERGKEFKKEVGGL